MNKTLENQIGQLSESEQEILSEYLKRQYAVEFKGESMLRDDIKDRVVELICFNFFDDKMAIDEVKTFQELELATADITSLAEMLIVEFELEGIEFSKVMAWETVKDIVDYLEDNLVHAVDDMDWKSKPYMPGFEPEA